jgi:hypothetical protein
VTAPATESFTATTAETLKVCCQFEKVKCIYIDPLQTPAMRVYNDAVKRPR